MMKWYLKHSGGLYHTPEQLLNGMSEIKYSDFIYLMSPTEVLVSKEGSCHDQALLEITELSSMGLEPKAKFLMSVDFYGQGGETHSFVYYEKGGYWYWFEHAWSDLTGIRKYHSEDELISSVILAFGKRVGFDRLYIADFEPEDHSIGEDLSTFVDICMNSAEEYQID